jgi:uncharacterized protein YdhG (YjbR/CyaY superfamily)
MSYIKVDDYILGFPTDVQEALQIIRQLVKKEVPDATEAMIYGVPGFKYNEKNLIAYAAFKKHIGIYPEPITIEHYKKELQRFKTSKGAIRFPLDEALPITLIQRIIKYKKEILSS